VKLTTVYFSLRYTKNYFWNYESSFFCPIIEPDGEKTSANMMKGDKKIREL
jgi:hypothetical protein